MRLFICYLLFIRDCNRVSSSGAPAICDVSASHRGTPAISGASTRHSARPTTEKTCKSVHRSTPSCYLRHRPAATTRLTPQETSVDLRPRQHKTTHNNPQRRPCLRFQTISRNHRPFNISVGHSQRSKGHADSLPSTTRSAAPTTVPCLRFQTNSRNHHRHHRLFPCNARPIRTSRLRAPPPTAATISHRSQRQQVAEAKEERNKHWILINLDTSPATSYASSVLTATSPATPALTATSLASPVLTAT